MTGGRGASRGGPYVTSPEEATLHGGRRTRSSLVGFAFMGEASSGAAHHDTEFRCRPYQVCQRQFFYFLYDMIQCFTCITLVNSFP